jgi:cytochrome c oxidase subunit II
MAKYPHLLLALTLLGATAAARSADPKVIEITARRFEFTPSEITLHKGEQVVLRVRSLDVTHGFFARALAIDTSIEPGKTTEVTVNPQAPGRYDIICDHFCGSGHGNMKMTVVVE